jgi:hypothetical protein
MIIPMWLPIPSTRAVEEFRAIMRREHSLEMTDEEARLAATKILQIYFLKTYAYRDLRSKIDRK